MKKHAFAFLDTNIYLHFQPAKDIDWCSLLDVEHVTIMVPRLIFSQLDRVKETGKTTKLRDRARRVAHRLEEYNAKERALIRDGVELEFFLDAPSIDYPTHGLDETVEDDRLLAAMLTFQEKMPSGSQLLLISDDTGPRVKAQHLNIKARGVPEDLRLPQELDSTEKELRDLRQKHEKWVLSRPILDLKHENGEAHAVFDLPALLGPKNDEKIEDELRELREQASKETSTLRQLSVPIPEEEFARYKEEVEDFLLFGRKLGVRSDETAIANPGVSSDERRWRAS